MFNDASSVRSYMYVCIRPRDTKPREAADLRLVHRLQLGYTTTSCWKVTSTMMIYCEYWHIAHSLIVINWTRKHRVQSGYDRRWSYWPTTTIESSEKTHYNKYYLFNSTYYKCNALHVYLMILLKFWHNF